MTAPPRPLPGAHFGTAGEKPVDWRKDADADADGGPDDDVELDKTPEDVIAMLGFDPKDEATEE